MTKRAVLILLLSLAVVSLARGSSPDYLGPIYTGAELDYQPAIIRVSPSGDLMVVFERIALPSFFGDLYVAFSSDGGATWTAPQAIVSSALNERHPALVQLAADSFALFYLVDETGSSGYRLHRATSTDGLVWTDQGALDLGWATPGEVNPCVIREADGALTMTYHRLSGPSYIARSADGGATWDTLKTQVSNITRCQLPAESDGLYRPPPGNPGGNNLDIYAKPPLTPTTGAAQYSPDAINSHDSQPIVLEDGTFLVTYASTPVNYFDLYYRTGRDGAVWSDGAQVTEDPNHYDTQPHPLLAGTPGYVMLAWSHQVGATPYVDHDVWINTALVIPSDLSTSLKTVDPAVFSPSDLLTYTLVLSNTGLGPTAARLADPIPAETAYQPGSLWATGGQYGYDPAGHTITWTGIIPTGGQISLTFQVTAAHSLSDGDTVTNTAWLTDGQGVAHTLSATATATVRLWRVYLPVVVKN